MDLLSPLLKAGGSELFEPVEMNIGGDGNNLRELTHQLQGETKGDVNTTVVEGDFKVHDPGRNIKYRYEGARQAPPAALQTSQQQQQSQGPVCWERFLNIRSLKVLLVETDYSTRHVVTALLRNCSYEVTEAANGFQAWKILEDPTNQIDLVLTEVVMPGLNGIGLLHKIVSHKTRHNVPVIMMSSHDSMGIVFKCLSKGAVDFLVKPIRKNELKNLWQHVWRRCHSSSGSGSESGTQTQKSVQSKGVEKSDNDSGSNDEYENGSMGLNVGDESDTGSGTQSSWTKQAVDMGSPLSATVEDQVAECPDSTCAQVIHSTAELSGNKHALVTKVKMCGGCKENTDDATCNDQERVVGNVDLKFIHQVEDTSKFVGTKEKHILEKGSGKLIEKIDKVNLDLNSEAPPHTLNGAASITGSNANTNGPITKNTGTKTSLRQSKISDAKAKALNDVKDAPSHEHDLKRRREGNDVGTAVQEDRNVLRRSDSSAFSRYNASASGSEAPGVNIQSGSPPDSATDKTKEKSVCDLQSHSNGDHPNQSSNIDMGSTTNRIALQNNPAVTSVKHLHPSSVFQPSKGVIFATQLIQSKQADDEAIRNMLVQSSDMFQVHLSQCLNHNCNHHDMQQQQQCCQQPELLPDHHDASLKKVTEAIPVEGTAGNYYSVNNGSASGSNHGSNEQNGSNGQNGSSTVVNTGGTAGNYYSVNNGSASGSNHGSNEQNGSNGQNGSSTVVNTGGTAGNYYSVNNGSASGSNHGSNEQNGSNGQNRSSTVVNTGGINLESDNGIAGKGGSGSGDGSGSGSGSGIGNENRVDQNKSSQRQAALTKFRQKRNERCFRKKVRYQSRKRIAEQRPRVRGQFVRQTANESSSNGTEGS